MLARLATERDREAVVELARLQVAETLPHLDFDADVTRATYGQFIARADPTIFVVEEGRQVVGFLMALLSGYAFTTGFFVSQEVIFVHPDKRGTRAAAALVSVFNEWADRLGAREVFTGIANGHKPERTARFFGHFGFTPVGVYLRRLGGEHGKRR